MDEPPPLDSKRQRTAEADDDAGPEADKVYPPITERSNTFSSASDSDSDAFEASQVNQETHPSPKELVRHAENSEHSREQLVDDSLVEKYPDVNRNPLLENENEGIAGAPYQVEQGPNTGECESNTGDFLSTEINTELRFELDVIPEESGDLSSSTDEEQSTVTSADEIFMDSSNTEPPFESRAQKESDGIVDLSDHQEQPTIVSAGEEIIDSIVISDTISREDKSEEFPTTLYPVEHEPGWVGYEETFTQVTETLSSDASSVQGFELPSEERARDSSLPQFQKQSAGGLQTASVPQADLCSATNQAQRAAPIPMPRRKRPDLNASSSGSTLFEENNREDFGAYGHHENRYFPPTRNTTDPIAAYRNRGDGSPDYTNHPRNDFENGSMRSEHNETVRAGDIQNVGIMPRMRGRTESALAVVYVAAQKSVHRLGICEKDPKLGSWKQTIWCFETYLTFENFVIFKGDVPVPSETSIFSFHFMTNESVDQYSEDRDQSDNRKNRLLPNSVNYFFLKPRPENAFERAANTLRGWVAGSNQNHIAVEFINIAHSHVLQEQTNQYWDSWFDSLSDAYCKITEELSCDTHAAFGKYLESTLSQQEEIIQNDFRYILILLTGAYIFGNPSTKLANNVFYKNTEAFSAYLLSTASEIKEHCKHFASLLKMLEHPNFTFARILLDETHETQYLTGFDLSPNSMRFLNESHGSTKEEMLKKAIKLLFNQKTNINNIYGVLKPFFDANKHRRSTIDRIFMIHLKDWMSNQEKMIEVLTSDLMEDIAKRALQNNESEKIKRFLKIVLILNIKTLFQISEHLPPHILPLGLPIIEEYACKDVAEMLQQHPCNDYETYEFFAKFDMDSLNKFPKSREKIELLLMKMTDQLIDQCEFRKIPSTRLMLLSLAKRENIDYLDTPSLEQLHSVLANQPRREFFEGLSSTLRANQRTIRENIKAHRSIRELADFCNKLQQHFDNVEAILTNVRNHNIELKEARYLLTDSHLKSYLLSSGLHEKDISDTSRKLEELQKRNALYADLYTKLAGFILPILENEGICKSEANEVRTQAYEIVDIDEWEDYLEVISIEESTATLRSVLEREPPLKQDYASWLNVVLSSRLFMEEVWASQVRELSPDNLASDEFLNFVKVAAQSWHDLAKSVHEGTTPFSKLAIVVNIEPDTKLLCNHHLIENGQAPFDKISDTLENYNILSNIQRFIGPFVNALRSFNIARSEAISHIHKFVEEKLNNNWNDLTLARLTQVGIIETLFNKLAIGTNPENAATIKFLASFVTEGNKTPLIDWLRSKTEQDFEAMGRILQGHLFEAYGQLQTLKTRIAPFLNQKFDTHTDLLNAIRDSEVSFAKRHIGSVPEVKFHWLSQMLPEIDTAIKASIASPSEDAKEKLGRLDNVHVLISPEQILIKVGLTGNTELSLDELKQSFQLLDLAAPDGGEKKVAEIRNNVEQIFRLVDVFQALFSSSFFIHYSQETAINITLMAFDVELKSRRAQLKEWDNFWQEIDCLQYLTLFSRDFLLYLARLVSEGEMGKVLELLRTVLPSAPTALYEELSRFAPKQDEETSTNLNTQKLRQILTLLNTVVHDAFKVKNTLASFTMPKLLESLKSSLEVEFLMGPIVILNVDRRWLVGASLAAYSCLTNQTVEPSRILFVTAYTGIGEVQRFMRLWTIGKTDDLFIIVHVERLSAAMATEIRDAVNRIEPKMRARLLLLAQIYCCPPSTKLLGTRLGIASDRKLTVDFDSTLRDCFANLSLEKRNIHFFTSQLPGCGKSQTAMKLASHLKLVYHRVFVRQGTVEELMERFKTIDSNNEPVFIHLDVGHSVSLEFNDILLSFILHGVLYDPRKSHLGYWKLGSNVTIGVELSSPLGADEYPIINYLGEHLECKCSVATFSYQLANMPKSCPGKVAINDSVELILAAKFLEIHSNGLNGVQDWNSMCTDQEIRITHPVANANAFRLLVAAYSGSDNQIQPTFTSLKAFATFIYRHVKAMIQSSWFVSSAELFLGDRAKVNQFRLDVFNLLVKVARDSLARCWSLDKKQHDSHVSWEQRQRTMLLLGVGDNGVATSINVAGRSMPELQELFHASLRPYLEEQSMLQVLGGVGKLLKTIKGGKTVLNVFLSLLHLDGTPKCLEKARQIHSLVTNGILPAECLVHLLGESQGYVLTGDNITKMILTLYRIRCGLPVIVFGEAGVGKSALFRFLIQTLLGHHLTVINVNSGTTIEVVKQSVQEAMKRLSSSTETTRFFLFFDEMNTADPTVIAFFKELMLDRRFEGDALPPNLHMIAAANPYRLLKKSNNKDDSAGLTFRFAQSKSSSPQNKNLVYRVNDLPRAFFDHIYDFGYLKQDAEEVYIEEICQHELASEFNEYVNTMTEYIKKSHVAIRKMSADPESAVSLRDTARAVKLFLWFAKAPAGRALYNSPDRASTNEISAQLAIYVAYAFRFTSERNEFLSQVFGSHKSVRDNVRQASRKITELVSDMAKGASIGSGAIALNDALCENLLGLFVCVLNEIFVIIVGRPGTSKSLSVEILKLLLSPGNHELREKLGGLPALIELYFQCSPLSTSAGFKSLFESAQKISADGRTLMGMVVLDELGLADLSPEKPIKVLHAELERKAVLTSGETKQPPYTVVALSNWVVDAAQVSRGILIRRRQADVADLRKSAEELADSLVKRYSKTGESFKRVLKGNLEVIVKVYTALIRDDPEMGEHFFSMRDFFFCVKHYVCSVFDRNSSNGLGNIFISDNQLIQSVYRNFGGHEKAKLGMKCILEDSAGIQQNAITLPPALDLIVQNIKESDSSKAMSVHVARHLMILNRSLIGLQLLNQHVRSRLPGDTGWTVLFGSCFPEDLQVSAVTRKLRQVEQAIRRGGVLVLCHADQLFESLYMVLNQQYWAQGDVTMTQIALGPSIRAIALPDGPLRIIALQETDVAVNSHLTSPAVLSRFEKHELGPHDLLDANGRELLSGLEAHPLLSAMNSEKCRVKMIFGYHQDLLASFALHFQTLLEDPSKIGHDAYTERYFDCLVTAVNAVLRACNPAAIIKFEKLFKAAVEDASTQSFHEIMLESLEDALNQVKSKRMVVMTTSQRYMDVFPKRSQTRYQAIRLFDIQTELEFDGLLSSLDKKLDDPHFCLAVQYDAVAGNIEQFQYAKNEIDANKLADAACRIVLIVHLDPGLPNNRWIFSYGDGWEYVFVDELHGHPCIPLKMFLQNGSLADLINHMTLDQFRSLLLEMLGPVLQTPLQVLGSNVGLVFKGVRAALSSPNWKELIMLLKACLMAQITDCKMAWNVLDAVDDSNFNSSSSLTESLWEIMKQILSKPLAHLLLISDVWRVTDARQADLWCKFIKENYTNHLLMPNSTTAVIQAPTGMLLCSQPFGRLFAQLDNKFTPLQDLQQTSLLRWLLGYVGNNQDECSEKTRNAYFCDWLNLRLPSHLRLFIPALPLSKIINIIEIFYEDPVQFTNDWFNSESEITVTLEHVKLIVPDNSNYSQFFSEAFSTLVTINNWKVFVENIVTQLFQELKILVKQQDRLRFHSAVNSIQTCPALQGVIGRSSSLSEDWAQLRMTNCVAQFNLAHSSQLSELHNLSSRKILECLSKLGIECLIQKRFFNTKDKTELADLLRRLNSCETEEELKSVLRQCSETKKLLFTCQAEKVAHCIACKGAIVENHLVQPDPGVIDSLFQDQQKFMLLSQQVIEIFITQKKNNTDEAKKLFQQLFTSNCALVLSWRFFVVIARSVLMDESTNIRMINGILLKTLCNSPNSELPFNTVSFLKALVMCADKDVESKPDPGKVNWSDAMADEAWSVDRIRRLAEIRRLLSNPGDHTITMDALRGWADRVRNQGDEEILDRFLIFVLRFTSGEGDETCLKAIMDHKEVPRELVTHGAVAPFTGNFAPMKLSFSLEPASGPVSVVQDRLLRQQPIDDIFPHYGMLCVLERDWAPHIARLATHAADVARCNDIHLLSALTDQPERAAEFYLPGIDNQAYLSSYIAEKHRWYVCECGTLCYVGDCGLVSVIQPSICHGCNRWLASAEHQTRDGVRHANEEDFGPPKGIYMLRSPDSTPGYTVRDAKPLVTRLALLLNSLCLLHACIKTGLGEGVAQKLLQTLPPEEQVNTANEEEETAALSLVLCRYVLTNLELLFKLQTTKSLTKSEQFRLGHLLLNSLYEKTDRELKRPANDFTGVLAREDFEKGLDRLITRNADLAVKLETVDSELRNSAVFYETVRTNESSYWMYARRMPTGRQTVQLALERNASLKRQLKFLNFVLDDGKWAPKLEALSHFANGARFIALVRSTLQGRFTREQAYRMSIAQGIEKISQLLSKDGPIVLDKGHAVRTDTEIGQLFEGFRQLWKRFSEIRNGEQRTFLEYFECQDIAEGIRPGSDLTEESPLILISAGSNTPETSFSCQLLASAVEAANSISRLPFVNEHCRKGTQTIRINCSSAAGMAEFDETSYAHVTRQEIDSFLVDYAIGESTLKLAEHHAMRAVLGSAGSTIVKSLALEPMPEFIFEETMDSANAFINIERRFNAWQPTKLSTANEEYILAELEKKRLLGDAKSLLTSVLLYVTASTEPLVINLTRERDVTDVIEELQKLEILTREHVSTSIIDAFNRPVQLKIHQAMSILKSVMRRMKGDDIFGGRIPSGYDVMLSEKQVKETNEALRSQDVKDIVEVFTVIASSIRDVMSSGATVPNYHQPGESLLHAVRNYKADDKWNGLPSELTLENLGHTLLLAEALL